MTDTTPLRQPEVTDSEWVAFPGGELEGRQPGALCPTCREKRRQQAGAPVSAGGLPEPLCFQCFRADPDRVPAPGAGSRASGSNADRPADAVSADEIRWQWLLPFEPVNRARLERLRAERTSVRAAVPAGPARLADRRRRAQMEARRVLDRLATGLAARQTPPADRDRSLRALAHAAELQFPEAWLPFVMSR